MEEKEEIRRIADQRQLNEGLNRFTVDEIELVVVKQGEIISVFSGVCLHDGALLASGFIDGDYLTCGSHLWRYHLKTGELDGEPGIYLKKLSIIMKNEAIYVKQTELEDLREEDW